jgi:acyl-coenzyme A thioesterase PaaI-like protein
VSEAAWVDDGRCFACGPLNPDGLHLEFVPIEDGARAQTVLPARFQGWRGTAHGGIVMTLLDEAMAHACGFLGERGVTAAMDLRFRSPVPIGEPVAVTAHVKWKRKNVIALEAAVTLADGTVLATAEGSFVSRGPLGKERYGIPDAG